MRSVSGRNDRDDLAALLELDVAGDDREERVEHRGKLTHVPIGGLYHGK